MNIKNSIFIVISLILLFGCTETSSVSGDLPKSVAIVSIEVDKSKLRILKAGDDFILPIKIKNQGAGVIPALGMGQDDSKRVFVTYHWFDKSGGQVVWDGIRTKLPRDLPPKDSIIGANLTIDLSVHAPSQPGQYFLMIDLVQEGVQWFADNGSETPRIEFNVTN